MDCCTGSDLDSASFGTVNAYIIASMYLVKSQIWGTVESESLLVGSMVGLMAKMEPNPLLTNTSGSHKLEITKKGTNHA